MVLADVGITRTKEMLDADKVNFHTARLSGCVPCLVGAKTTYNFLYLFQIPYELHLCYKIFRRYKKLENHNLTNIIIRGRTGSISANSDITRRLEMFRMAEFYGPEIAMLKSAFIASCLDRKDLHSFVDACNMLDDNEKLKEIGQDEIMFELEEPGNRNIVNSHHYNERQGACIDAEMVQHSDEAYVIRCWSFSKNGHISFKRRLKK